MKLTVDIRAARKIASLSTEGLVLPLFQQRGPTDLMYGVIVGQQHRAADDWEDDLPTGYTTPAGVTLDDCYIDSMDKILYPNDSHILKSPPPKPVVQHQISGIDTGGRDLSLTSTSVSSSPATATPGHSALYLHLVSSSPTY